MKVAEGYTHQPNGTIIVFSSLVNSSTVFSKIKGNVYIGDYHYIQSLWWLQWQDGLRLPRYSRIVLIGRAINHKPAKTQTKTTKILS